MGVAKSSCFICFVLLLYIINEFDLKIYISVAKQSQPKYILNYHIIVLKPFHRIENFLTKSIITMTEIEFVKNSM